MWQLQLLRDVMPAFHALARHLLDERDEDGEDGNDAQLVPKQCLGDCYVDMMNIHAAVSSSGDEWKPGLDEAVLTNLLKGLESRFLTRSTSVRAPVRPAQPRHLRMFLTAPVAIRHPPMGVGGWICHSSRCG